MIIELTLDETGLFAGNQICTHSGMYVDVLDPKPETIFIEDIAHALSRQPRFAGHLDCDEYSVAEHSLNVAEWLRQNGASKRIQLYGLLHDASEAYLIDVPSPAKNTLEGYKPIEDLMMRTIWQRFGLLSQPLIVKTADRYMLAREWHEFRLHKVVKEPLVQFPWYVAKKLFLKQFQYLYETNLSPVHEMGGVASRNVEKNSA